MIKEQRMQQQQLEAVLGMFDEALASSSHVHWLGARNCPGAARQHLFLFLLLVFFLHVLLPILRLLVLVSVQCSISLYGVSDFSRSGFCNRAAKLGKAPAEAAAARGRAAVELQPLEEQGEKNPQ